jgi:hypothetical protein
MLNWDEDNKLWIVEWDGAPLPEANNYRVQIGFDEYHGFIKTIGPTNEGNKGTKIYYSNKEFLEIAAACIDIANKINND